ncbi:S8 family peptidase [Foetidibacter luteolus]|uniref:S8 family peptidase n=1 Tax=Foetidibacter luteolus TaxID=2608880 RepID=UPI00129BB804|nr:S8 family peptidase [Foetidibacter luteolus]
MNKPAIFCLLFSFCCLLLHAQVTEQEYVKDYALHDLKDSLPAGQHYYIAGLNSDNVFCRPEEFSIVRRLGKNLAIIHVERLTDSIRNHLRFLFPANNKWKLSPRFSTSPTGKGKYLIRLLNRKVNTLNKHKLTVLYSYQNSYIVSAQQSVLPAGLLADDNVLFIDNHKSPVVETVLNGMDLSTNKITAAHSLYPAIAGDSLTASIKENLFDTTDVDLTNRYISTGLASSITESHAGIMATLIGGAGNSYYTGKGVAYRANLTSSDFTNLLPDSDDTYSNYSISVQNHSYGTGIENYYGADAAAYDETATRHPSLVHVFSAGNSGDKTSDTGVYKGIANYANITGSFKMAKNIITVGSIDSFYHVLPLSSRGPAFDGRVKPELVAYGTDGSSGAAAIVSGTALLLQQAYKQKHGHLPPGPIVKALLLNTADDVAAKGIDYQSGFGSLNALRALEENQAQHFTFDSLSTGETKQYSLQLPANAVNLKVLVCWADPPATPNSYKALVNDLDLQLVNTLTNEIHQPLVLNAFPLKDSLQQQARPGRDSLNNVEQVTILHPGAATYQVQVSGRDVPQGRQAFAIAYQWDTLNSFTWLYPTKNDNLAAGDINTVRWQSNLADEQARLEISYNKNAGWQNVGQTNISNNLHSFTVKDSFRIAQLRVLFNGNYFYSDSFTVSKRLGTGVGFNCPDSFLLYWQQAPGIQQYRVYGLGQFFLEQKAITSDTFMLIPKAGNPLYYAVSPVIGNYDGIKSYGFDYTTQGVDCYIRSFLADLATPSTALVRIELGTNINLRYVTLEKQYGTQIKNLATWQPVTSTSYTFTDDSLTQGLNLYRLRVVLTDGRSISSDIQTVNYLNNKNFIVFPNPLRAGQTIKILTSQLNNYQFILYSSLGKKLIQANLPDISNEIYPGILARGVYFYAISLDGQVVYKGKLVAQ